VLDAMLRIGELLTYHPSQFVTTAAAATSGEGTTEQRAADQLALARRGNATDSDLRAISTKVDCVTTRWCCKQFALWLEQRCGFVGDFAAAEPAQLDTWLARFCLELNRPDGTPHTTAVL
jgi:hypothetical protein